MWGQNPTFLLFHIPFRVCVPAADTQAVVNKTSVCVSRCVVHVLMREFTVSLREYEFLYESNEDLHFPLASYF